MASERVLQEIKFGAQKRDFRVEVTFENIAYDDGFMRQCLSCLSVLNDKGLYSVGDFVERQAKSHKPPSGRGVD